VTLPLFVYGTLRDPRVRAGVLGQRIDLTTCPAVLRRYARQTVPGVPYPFLVPAGPALEAEARVDGELILGLAEADYPILDEYEDVADGLYVRAAVTVETDAGPVDAWTYLKGPAAPS
jgi:gamma-glutamylcyclotransferase (GGCT)/AIG2-like uncharacterized protein YtfP